MYKADYILGEILIMHRINTMLCVQLIFLNECYANVNIFIFLSSVNKYCSND